MRVLIIKSILYLCAFLPLPLIHGVGVIFGWGLFLIPNRIRQISEINIALCWPERTTDARGKLLRASMIETGKTIIESGALWLRPGTSTLRLIKQVEGCELVEQAIAKGNGVILATPHLGAWECAGLYCAARFNITCLYKPLKITGLEKLVLQARSRMGGRYLPATGRSIRTLYKTLAQGNVVAMLPDQEPQAGNGIFSPFFGIPAFSMVLPARLAARSGAPVILVCCERLSWGRGYRLRFRATPAATNPANINATVDAVNKATEDCIRKCPTQYQWGYQRFRTRPAGEESFYRPSPSVSRKQR
jgi:KDO2-lipid IV(A) lauroyltransferase